VNLHNFELRVRTMRQKWLWLTLTLNPTLG